MEGRHPPPKAAHPFPNNPDMTKFWGPMSRAMFRSLFCVMGAFLTAAGVNMYLTRHEKGPFGTDITMRPGQLRTMLELSEKSSIVENRGLNGLLQYKHKQNHLSLGPVDMKFDDGVIFVPQNPPQMGVTFEEE